MIQSKQRNSRLRTLEPSFKQDHTASKIKYNNSKQFKLPSKVSNINQVKNPSSYRYLQKLEEDVSIISQKSPKYKSSQLMMLSSHAYSFQRSGNLDKAFECIKMAQNIEKIQSIDRAKVLINKSALMNKIGKHQQSLELNKQALNILKEQSKKFSNKQDCSQICQMLVICLYNISADLQFLGRNQQARNLYNKGLNLSIRTLGTSHELSQKIKKIVSSAKVARNMSNKKLSQPKQTPKNNFISKSQNNNKLELFKEKPYFKIYNETNNNIKTNNIKPNKNQSYHLKEIKVDRKKVNPIQKTQPNPEIKNQKFVRNNKLKNSEEIYKDLGIKNNKNQILFIAENEERNKKNSANKTKGELMGQRKLQQKLQYTQNKQVKKQIQKATEESQCTIM